MNGLYNNFVLITGRRSVALHPARADAACDAIAHAVERNAQACLGVGTMRLRFVAAIVLQAFYAQIAADVGHDLFGTAGGAAHGGVLAKSGSIVVAIMWLGI